MKPLIQTLFLLMLIGCSDGSPLSEGEIISTVVNQLRDIEGMTQQGHPSDQLAERYMGYFSADPVVLPFDGELLVGRESIQAFYAKAFSMGTLVSNVYTAPVIDISKGYVVRVYKGTAEIQLPESEQTIRFTNVYTDVLLKEKGEWKIQWHSWVPAPADK